MSRSGFDCVGICYLNPKNKLVALRFFVGDRGSIHPEKEDVGRQCVRILEVEHNNTVQPHWKFVVKCMSHVGRDAIIQSVQSLRVVRGMSRSTRLCPFILSWWGNCKRRKTTHKDGYIGIVGIDIFWWRLASLLAVGSWRRILRFKLFILDWWWRGMIWGVQHVDVGNNDGKMMRIQLLESSSSRWGLRSFGRGYVVGVVQVSLLTSDEIL